jgi:RND family efflux transporter MFP subunit
MVFLDRLYGWYGKRTVRAVGAALLVLIVVIIVKSSEDDVAPVTEVALPQVTVATPAALASGSSVSLIGTVAPKTQAKLVSEASGRVVAVNASLGQYVTAGSIIAQLENASERAAVLQAEGVYEAALAAARASALGVDSAASNLVGEQNSAITTHASAYTTVSNIVRTDLDPFYGNPDGQIIGLKVDGQGYQTSLIQARRALQTTLPEWQARATNLSTDDNIAAALTAAERVTTDVLALLDMFIAAFSDTNSNLSDDVARGYVSDLNTKRASLLATTAALQAAGTQLTAAYDALSRAEAAGSQSTPVTSAAEAQVKQALGALRAAQANNAKTVIRTPISGTVNALSVAVGDFVGQSVPVAEVANNAGLEVTTYVSENEARTFTIGQPVSLGKNATGTVTSISPAIDTTTGKVELRIDASGTELKAGSTVSITITTAEVPEDTRVLVPLTAIKLSTDAALVYTVSASSTLVANRVVLGNVTEEFVEITEGLTNDTLIVVDARGRKVGETVTLAE